MPVVARRCCRSCASIHWSRFDGVIAATLGQALTVTRFYARRRRHLLEQQSLAADKVITIPWPATSLRFGASVICSGDMLGASLLAICTRKLCSRNVDRCAAQRILAPLQAFAGPHFLAMQRHHSPHGRHPDARPCQHALFRRPCCDFPRAPAAHTHAAAAQTILLLARQHFALIFPQGRTASDARSDRAERRIAQMRQLARSATH